jgi:TolB-like protein
MSNDPDQEFFADGIAEDIITALSRYPSLFVIARNSSFTYKGRAIDVKQVGRELGVRYILEGSLRKAGNRIRVTAQLVEADTGSHVWAERYDRDLADIFAVQDEITEAVTIAVAPAIAEAERHRAMRKAVAAMQHKNEWEWTRTGGLATAATRTPTSGDDTCIHCTANASAPGGAPTSDRTGSLLGLPPNVWAEARQIGTIRRISANIPAAHNALGRIALS